MFSKIEFLVLSDPVRMNPSHLWCSHDDLCVTVSTWLIPVYRSASGKACNIFYSRHQLILMFAVTIKTPDSQIPSCLYRLLRHTCLCKLSTDQRGQKHDLQLNTANTGETSSSPQIGYMWRPPTIHWSATSMEMFRCLFAEGFNWWITVILCL